jgi:hypothetical protein
MSRKSQPYRRPDHPLLTLRGGDAIDDGGAPPPFDEGLDRLSPEYLERYHAGISYLDPESWRYYLPVFIGYAISNLTNPNSLALNSFLFSLRPPERTPPRFEPLSESERGEITHILDKLAFDDASAWKDQAINALEEYWAPGALYRRSHEA